MKTEPRPRRLTVGVYNCEAFASWGKSEMKFIDCSGDGARREVTLRIETPYDLLYIEEQIAKIRSEWKRQLEMHL